METAKGPKGERTYIPPQHPKLHPSRPRIPSPDPSSFPLHPYFQHQFPPLRHRERNFPHAAIPAFFPLLRDIAFPILTPISQEAALAARTDRHRLVREFPLLGRVVGGGGGGTRAAERVDVGCDVGEEGGEGGVVGEGGVGAFAEVGAGGEGEGEGGGGR